MMMRSRHRMTNNVPRMKTGSRYRMISRISRMMSRYKMTSSVARMKMKSRYRMMMRSK